MSAEARHGLRASRATRAGALAAAVLVGCHASYDPVVTTQELRRIAASDLETMPALPGPPPTTLPVTRPSTLPAAAQPAEVSLTLDEVRRQTIENNLDLRLQRFGPTIAREALSEEEARFDALFTTDVRFARLDQPTASQLNSSQVTDVAVAPGIQFPLRTGGTISLSAPLDRFENNNQFSTLNPAYSSDLVARISQPLLRGAGPLVAERPIRIANYQYKQAQVNTKLEITRILANADRLYWRLYAAREALRVRKQEYDLAFAQLERARRQVRAGAAASAEVTRAESGVADSIEQIILADNQVRLNERDLKRTLNTSDLDLNSTTAVVPTTEPKTLYVKVDPEKLAEEALRQRMELLEAEIRIADATDAVRVARNGLLPLVLVDYTYGINGLGPSLDDSLKMTRDKDFEDHTVGVRVEIPITNEAARSRLRQALASRLLQLATKQQRTLLIRQEVYNAVDVLNANYQRILAARQRVVAAARVLDVETRFFTQGLRTTTDVLIAQRNLANARLSEISALADYQIAQVDIAFATGTVLGSARVDWLPVPPPRTR